MTTLVTFNGRFGDLLWALPTLRCLADASGSPVSLLIGEEFASLCPLLRLQPYIDEVDAVEGWTMSEKRPRMVSAADQVLYISYPEWPTTLLPRYTWQTAAAQWHGDEALPPLDLDTPWITIPDAPSCLDPYITACWTEEWIELKMGVTVSVANALNFPLQARQYQVHITHLRGRHREFNKLGCASNIEFAYQPDWIKLAQLIQHAACYLGCLSAPWVLANALGQQTVVVEPSQARLDPIFYYDHPRNHLVRGGDGKPTFHALHVREMLKEVLESK